jgi:hypothetical protein
MSDVVGLYQFMSSYVQYATGTCMLNFGYWVKGSSGSLKMLRKLVEMKGESEYLHEKDILYYQVSQVTFLPKNRNMTVTLNTHKSFFVLLHLNEKENRYYNNFHHKIL